MKYQKILFLIGLLIISGCSATRYLEPGQALLYKQDIKGSKKIPKEEMEAFYRQKPNRRILFLPINPYVAIYYKGKRKYDKQVEKDRQKLAELEKSFDEKLANPDLSEKQRQKLIVKREKKTSKLRRRIDEGNWLMRIGEKVSVFDSVLMRKTREQMQLYLHQKGYFGSSVTASYEIKNQKAFVLYRISEGKPHHINQIVRLISDSTMYRLIVGDTTSALVKAGDRYDEVLMGQERDRITRFLKDRGYYNFTRQYIFYEVDSNNIGERRLNVRLLISNPEGKTQHQQYEISEVKVTTDVNVPTDKVGRNMMVYDSIRYFAYVHKYSKKVLNQKIAIRPGELYNQSKMENTQRSLATMDIFRFVNIKYDTAGTKLRANILMSPLQKYNATIEGGMNIVNQANVPGPFFSVALKNRNPFRGCEIFELRGRGSIDAQSADTARNRYENRELSLNASLIFPRIVFPLSQKLKKKIGVFNPHTRLLAGYTFVDRGRSYTRVNSQGVVSYDWTNNRNSFFTFNLVDANIVNTIRLDSAFEAYLNTLRVGGNTLYNSFRSAFVSSTSFNFIYNTYATAKKSNSLYIRAFAESGGTTLNLLGQEQLSKIFGSLSYFKYVKLNTEARYYLPLSLKSMVASRLNMGWALPYGETAEGQRAVLPYEKYFFTGGSNTIRAWRPRRLGPGAYVNRTDGNPDYRFEQPGEILLEMNLEYRQNLFSFFNVAAFVDAGNVWMNREDESRPGSGFKFNHFVSQIAVGTGVGLRLDFSFLVLRADLGIKVIDPAREKGERFVLFNNDKFMGNKALLNIGIGYPF